VLGLTLILAYEVLLLGLGTWSLPMQKLPNLGSTLCWCAEDVGITAGEAQNDRLTQSAKVTAPRLGILLLARQGNWISGLNFVNCEWCDLLELIKDQKG